MSVNEKDNTDFEFIKEQVIEKKRKKLRKKLLPPLKTVGLAILFGVTAAAVFAIVEPRLSKSFNRPQDMKTPVSFPTEQPENNDMTDISDKAAQEVEKVITPVPAPVPDPKPVVVKQSIDADLNDYLLMNEEIRKVALKVNKSIVNIASTFLVKDLFDKTVTKTVNTTGVIIYNNTKELLILVSLDKVQDAKNIKLILSDKISVNAILHDYEEDINIAVIAVALEEIPEAYMNDLQVAVLGESYTLSVGTPVIALGSPNGHADSMDIGTITSLGSCAKIIDNHLDLFNTSIEDNKNSDGIIVNFDGEVIGVITRKLKEDENEFLNTAIGISKLLPILSSMGNKEPRIYFGIKTNDMTNDAKKEHKIDNGIYVDDVQAKSPAFDAGIQNGDIIISIDNKLILGSNDFYKIISNFKPGDKINIKLQRSNGAKEPSNMNINVVLADKPAHIE